MRNMVVDVDSWAIVIFIHCHEHLDCIDFRKSLFLFPDNLFSIFSISLNFPYFNYLTIYKFRKCILQCVLNVVNTVNSFVAHVLRSPCYLLFSRLYYVAHVFFQNLSSLSLSLFLSPSLSLCLTHILLPSHGRTWYHPLPH